MQNQHKPVLIFAQSGRYLAQSATQAGYRVWVADCFGDQDTLAIAERWQPIPDISTSSSEQILTVLSQLSGGEECTLICGSGIESVYSMLNYLPSHIQLIGNAAKTIHTIKTPPLFFNMLAKLGVAYPETLFKLPVSNQENYIAKSSSGIGGTHIKTTKNALPLDHDYFQRLVIGLSGSALFSANGEKAELISINKQYLNPSNQSPFRLGSIETPWNIERKYQFQLNTTINKITKEVGLLGLNSIDFILSQENELLILEINPRPSASMELSPIPLFQHHIDSSLGQPSTLNITHIKTLSSLRTVYAQKNVSVPSTMKWPATCHDLPNVGTVIKQGSPICTTHVKADNIDKLNKIHLSLEKEILIQLHVLK